MKRLTQDFGNGQYGVIGCGENCKHNYKYCESLMDCPTIDEIINRLGQYEDAEEQGLLLRLSCKVGRNFRLPHHQKTLEYEINKGNEHDTD